MTSWDELLGMTPLELAARGLNIDQEQVRLLKDKVRLLTEQLAPLEDLLQVATERMHLSSVTYDLLSADLVQSGVAVCGSST